MVKQIPRSGINCYVGQVIVIWKSWWRINQNSVDVVKVLTTMFLLLWWPICFLTPTPYITTSPASLADLFLDADTLHHHVSCLSDRSVS